MRFAAGSVATTRAGSYPAISPLPDHQKCRFYQILVINQHFKRSGGILSVALSVPAAKMLSIFEGWTRELPGIMSYGARTFLLTVKMLILTVKRQLMFIAL